MILTKWLTQKIINIALANDKTEKKDFMVSAWLFFGYGWSVFG